MKRIILLALSFITAHNIFAQEKELLKNFKYRIDNYRAITLNAYSGGQYDKRDLAGGTHTNSYFQTGLGGSYYTTKSTDKILLSTTTGLYGSYIKARSADQTNTANSRDLFSFPSFAILNKWFAKKMFTELGANVSGIFVSAKTTATGSFTPAKDKERDYAAAINLGIGTGRLENITDMQNALWLYKALVKADRLPANLSGADLNELGKSITKGNNTRVLDARRRTQFLLTAVDNYLQQKGFINKTDMTYFSNLNDILFFAFNNQRLSGTEKFVRVTPSIKEWNGDQLQTNGMDKFKHDFTSQSVVFSSGIKRYHPVNLVHQNNYGASLKLAYISTDLADRDFSNGILVSEIKGTNEIKQAAAELFFEHSIYPNTRTVFNFNLQSELGYQYDGAKGFYTSSGLNCSLNYFISYHTRFYCGISAYYQKNKYYIERYLEMLPNIIQLNANAGLEINL
jgi:hypothetical protein